MKTQKDFYRLKVWIAFILLFACGSMVGIGIANWGHSLKNKSGQEPVVEQPAKSVENQGGGVAAAIRGFVEREKNKSAEDNVSETLSSCQTIEKVLLRRIEHDDGCCSCVKRDLEIYKKLASYGCNENIDKYRQEINNQSAILDIACDATMNGQIDARPCVQIEENLLVTKHLDEDWVEMSAEERIDRAKTYAVLAERGCPENTQKYTDLARKELEIARGISDEKFDENETIEVVETYKRLKMQQDAEEIFNKAKKLTNPAIDFIMQVEKIINE